MASDLGGKGAMYYTLVRRYPMYAVMKVTSEGKRRINGSIDGVASSCRHGDNYGQFRSEEAAIAKINTLREIYDAWGPRIKEATAALREAERKQREAILQAMGAMPETLL